MLSALSLTPQPRVDGDCHEELRGGFSMRAIHPMAGVRDGASTPLALLLSASARDLERIGEDPRHCALLRGHLVYAPYGPNPVAVWGTVRMVWGHGPAFVRYALHFKGFAGRCTLVGRTTEASPVAPWRGGRPLYSEIREGGGGGPTLGAGVLFGPPARPR